MRSCDKSRLRSSHGSTYFQLSETATARANKHGQHILKLTVARFKTSPAADIDIQQAHPFHLQLN